MAGENTVSTLDGNFKDQFHKQVEDLKPDHVILQREGFIDWVPSDKTNGELYSVPTLLRSNQGVTYLGEAGGVTQLKSPKAAVMKEAQIKGSEINVRGQLSYKALSQASSAGPKAFKKTAAWLVEDLAQVAYTRIEIAALYGQTGLGVVESVTDVTPGSIANIVITDATFAPGIWVLLEGATIDAFTGTAKNNSATVLTVSSVTTSTRTVKVTYGVAVAITTEVAAGDDLYFEGAYAGASSWSEMVGLYKQFTNVSSTLFNIDRSAYTLMQPNVKTSTGTISKAKILTAAMLAVDKGLMSDVVCMVSTKAWAVLSAEDMALRSFDTSYSTEKSKSGSKAMEYSTVSGTVKVLCHPMVKYGEAFIFNAKDVLWIGSARPTFEIPGMEEKFFRVVSDYNAVELQNYADLAVYHLKPCQAVMMTGITYS